MFERVGRGQRGDRRRQGGAVAVSGAVGVAVLAGVLALGGRGASAPERAEDDGVGVMFEPLPGGGGGGGAPEPVRAAVPTLRPAPAAPPRAAEAAVRTDAPRVSVPPESAVAGGPGGGGPATGPGEGPGAGPGQGPGPGGPGVGPGGGPGDRAVTPAKVLIRRAPDFRYPEAAHALALGAVRCELRYLVDARGRPERVDIVDCPEVFHREISLRAHKARFAPARVDGRAVPARFVLGVTFRPTR